MRPTLRQLEYVGAVAEHGSFHRAARACHVTQPELSAQIAQVESLLELRLFERNRRKVLVTPAGEALAPPAPRLPGARAQAARGHDAGAAGTPRRRQPRPAAARARGTTVGLAWRRSSPRAAEYRELGAQIARWAASPQRRNPSGQRTINKAESGT